MVSEIVDQNILVFKIAGKVNCKLKVITNNCMVVQFKIHNSVDFQWVDISSA